MSEIKGTLISEGTSDRVLIPIITWLTNNLYPKMTIDINYADFPGKKGDIQGEINLAIKNFPFDILFYHRDADKMSVADRKKEIISKITNLHSKPIVCVIPVKMTEAWLLIDKEAIKKAAGNRNFPDNKIALPKVKELEKQSKPKKLLYDLLKQATGKQGRHLDRFSPDKATHSVARNISDFSALRQLDAFKAFEQDLKEAVEEVEKKPVKGTTK